MEEKYKKLFGYVNLMEPPKGLGSRILSFINNEEKRLARFKAWTFGSSSLASLGFLLWAVTYLLDSMNKTGFWQYVSLLFSGDGAIYIYWKELATAMIESLPIASVIIFLAAIGFFIWSITKITYQKHEYGF